MTALPLLPALARRVRALALPPLALAAALFAAAPGVLAQDGVRPGDYIVAVVNSELVTANEVAQRLAAARAEAPRAGTRPPPEAELRRRVLDQLIDERVIITHARDSGLRVDDPEVDRAVQSVAAQNRLTVEQLRERLREEGLDMPRFRANLRDQLLVERIREREVLGRIRITDTEVDEFIEAERRKAGSTAQVSVAQLLVSVREGADDAEVAQRRARAEQALARIRAGEPFAVVVRELSDDTATRDKGGELGARPLDRLPTLFADAIANLPVGGVAGPVRSGAGFHLLKVVERVQDNPFRITQTRARHILLRPASPEATEAAARRLRDLKRDIESGARRFEVVARESSEDGSAEAGGDLGWTSPGDFVPEFEEVMNRLVTGAVSEPVATRFGVHLIQVLERRQVEIEAAQLREQARAALRERKFASAYNEWVRELRNAAFVEFRDPPA